MKKSVKGLLCVMGKITAICIFSAIMMAVSMQHISTEHAYIVGCMFLFTQFAVVDFYPHFANEETDK